MNSTPPSRLTINLDAIAANWRLLDARHPGQTAGVVKANAYGLGATYVAPKLFAAGCKHFFTAHLAEALTIRPLVGQAQVMVLHGVLPGEAEIFVQHDITPVLSSLPEVALWGAAAKRLGRRLPAFLQIDTGMSRLGLSFEEIERLFNNPDWLTGINIIYVMTHLMNAEIAEHPSNAAQYQRISQFQRQFQAQFPDMKLSLANSSGLFLAPQFASDLARPGAALYGINPTPGQANPLHPVVALHGKIIALRDIKPGTEVGYNGVWAAQRPSRIATVAVGYADGYFRSLTNRACGYFDGTPAPLVGRVSMDLTTFDVTEIANLNLGDSLELLGPHCTPDDLARAANTNGYEVLTALGARYERHYIGAVPAT
ncbi:MAG: alanine racemase [Acidocella sp.]|nr:alanine racemase [Acidocella sp.]